MTLSIAVVGLGRRASLHLPVIKALKGRYRLVAVCDLDPEASRAAAARFGCASYTDIRELVDHEQIDVADIVTPIPSHHALSIFLAQHRICQICETPIALTTDLADKMIDEANRNGLVLSVAENAFREPVVRMWSQIIACGLVGKVLRAYCMAYQSRCHAINLLNALCGSDAARVWAIKSTNEIDSSPMTGDRDRSEEWLAGFVEHEDGPISIYDSSSLAHADLLGRRALPRLQVDGTDGTIANRMVYLSGRDGDPLRIEDVPSDDGSGLLRQLRLAVDPPLTWNNVHAGFGSPQTALVDLFLDHAAVMSGEKACEYPARRARDELATYAALQESALRGGEQVPLPLSSASAYERHLHAVFERAFNVDPWDIDAVIDVRFGNR